MRHVEVGKRSDERKNHAADGKHQFCLKADSTHEAHSEHWPNHISQLPSQGTRSGNDKATISWRYAIVSTGCSAYPPTTGTGPLHLNRESSSWGQLKRLSSAGAAEQKVLLTGNGREQ